MNKEHNDKQSFGAADILRYLAGNMLPEEMHRLEAAALEDPFLADAIEGMRLRISSAGGQALQQDIEELRSGINKGRTTRLGMWWKVAAILFVVITGIAITYSIVQNENGDGVLVSHVQTREAESPRKTYSQKATALATDSLRMVTPGEKAAPAPAKMKREPTDENNDANNEVEKDAVSGKPAAQNEVSAAQPRPADATNPGDSTELNQQLKGRAAGIAVNENEAPLPAKSQGYEPNRETAEPARANNEVNKKNRTNSNNVRMENNAGTNSELNEVVVVGLGATRNNPNERTLNTAISKRFEPEGGWTTFHNYINNNRTLTASPDNNLEEVSFIPDEKGRPSDFRIHQSISREHDAETIRLLTEGPSWKILRGKKKRITIHMYF